MTPEKVKGTNMWRLLKDEYFVDRNIPNKRNDGPDVVRVTHYPEDGFLAVQGKAGILEVSGKEDSDFAAAVRKKK